MLARRRGKDLVFLSYKNEPQLQLTDIHSMLRTACDAYPQEEWKIDFSSHHTWFIIHCHASLEAVPEQSLNHFIPAWHRSQFNYADWAVALASARKHVADFQADIKFKMLEMLGDDRDRTATPQEMEKFEGLIAQEKYGNNMAKALTRFEEIGLVPEFVPADGNCGLWSVWALERMHDPDVTHEDYTHAKANTTALREVSLLRKLATSFVGYIWLYCIKNKNIAFCSKSVFEKNACRELWLRNWPLAGSMFLANHSISVSLTDSCWMRIL